MSGLHKRLPSLMMLFMPTNNESPEAQETHMTTRELAAYCRTSESTCRFWRTTGYGPPGRRVGRRVLYRRQDVDAWLASLPTDAGRTR